VKIERLDGAIYRAAEGFERELEGELDDARPIGGGLYLAPGRRAEWAIDVWSEPVRITFDKLAGAASALLSLGPRWTLLPVALFDRAAHVERMLPPCPLEPIRFPARPPPAPGVWTLAARNEIYASAKTASPFPAGEPRFVEDKTHPPSRAYLKLWEALTLLGEHPKRGDVAIDLGSSPGGWTWVLQSLGARVVSVDKAPLAPAIAKLPRVESRQESAFALDPRSFSRVDWLVSDVICFPERMVALVLRWLAAHPKARFVVTIKLKGATDTRALDPLRAVPGSRLVHLFHNRHELTWMRP